MTLSEDGSHDGIMSERTLNIAGRIYAELQAMIHVHGDEVIAELMPLIVSVLEELDVSFQECDDAVQALEELRDELAQCKMEIKRQRQLRELIEEEKSATEDVLEVERRRLSDQHLQLQTINRSININLSAKKEYIHGLEGRMTELEKDHRDLERRHVDTIQKLTKTKKTVREQSLIIEKSLNSTTSLSTTPVFPRTRTQHPTYLPDNIDLQTDLSHDFLLKETMFSSTPIKNTTNENIPINEINISDELKMEKLIMGDIETKEKNTSADSPVENEHTQRLPLSMRRTESEEDIDDIIRLLPDQQTGQNLYDELHGVAIPTASPIMQQALLRDTVDSPCSRRSSTHSAGDYEMQSLLKEKQNLDEHRSKLLKENNDLLVQLHETESISEAKQSKLKCLELENNNITEKLVELEATLKMIKNAQNPVVPQKLDQSDDPKRFTRSEMDKVIREKNMYKEKYLDLQEDVSTRYVEIQTEGPNEKSKFWTLFSGLFARRRAASETSTDDKKMRKLPDFNEENQNRLLRRKGAMASRHFIQGWSLPHDVATQSLADMDFIQSIPAPIYCGPLGPLDNERKSLVRCCATADDSEPLETRYMTWVCCEKDGQGEVFIVDPANPTEIQQTFVATKSAIICISYVPAAEIEDQERLDDIILSDVILSDSDNESGSDADFELCSADTTHDLFLYKPTFWLGTQSGFVAIHSAVEQCDTLLNRVRLKDSVLEIRYLRTHDVVLIGCADSSIAIFTKHRTDRGWNMDNFRVVMLGKSMIPLPVSVITLVKEHAWAAYGGNIAVLTLPLASIKDDIVFSEGARSLVTHMVAVGNGVWISCRFSSILTLLDTDTIQPLQQINMEEVLKPVSVSYGFTTLIRVSAVLCYNNLLWIGTSQGAMVTIPLKSLSPSTPSYVTEPPADSSTPMFAVRDEARISLHGHQGAVRYIIVAKYNTLGELDSRKLSNSNSDIFHVRRRTTCTRIVLSGGEGYISYRDMDAGMLSTIRRGRIIRGFTDHCHMIAWDVSGPRTICN